MRTPSVQGNRRSPWGLAASSPTARRDCGSGTVAQGRGAVSHDLEGGSAWPASSVGGSASKQGVRQLHGTVASDRPRV